MEEDITFGVYACSGSIRGPFNGAVDLFIIEAFVYVTSIAGDPGISRPAVNVAVLWVCWVREEVHGGLGDTFGGGTGGAVVGADEVTLSGEYVA